MLIKVFLPLAVLAALVIGVVFLRGTDAEPIREERLVEPQVGSIVRGVIAVGRVKPRTRIEVKSKANGIIQKLHVDVGDEVREGDVLVVLDREILEARLEEAEGRLSQAEAALELARANLSRIELQIEKNPEFVYAGRNWNRVQKLFDDGLASEDERDLALERYETAEYRKDLLEADLRSSRATETEARGRVQEVRAQTELARQELKEATIVSPIDGVVLYRYLEEGDAVSSIRVAGGNASNIMTLGDLSELYVDGEVDEVDVGKIIDEQRVRKDLVARVTVESFKGRTFLGHVARITPLGLEDRNGIVTYEVRIVFDNVERLLLANMTANSVIVLEEKEDVLLLSQGALITERGDRFANVYDARSGGVRRRKVEIGISDGSQVEILDGLRPGDKVLIP